MSWPRIRKPLIVQNRTDVASARAAAMALLARRDYATSELLVRLTDHGFSEQAVAAAISELTQERLLDDSRYAHNYVAYQAGRGRGPIRIAAELRRHGVEAAAVDAALRSGLDWRALARKVCRAKFGPQPPQNLTQTARQARFLQYRGFSADQIRAATGAEDLEPTEL